MQVKSFRIREVSAVFDMGHYGDFGYTRMQGGLQELFESANGQEQSLGREAGSGADEEAIIDLTPEKAWDIYRNFADAFGLKTIEDGDFNPFDTPGLAPHEPSNFSNEEFMYPEKGFKAQFQFTARDKAEVAAYVVFMVLGLIGNISAVAFLIKSRYRRSRIHLLLLNLTAADLIVVSVSIPVEIGWRISASWEAGDWACRIFVGFVRAFPLYASSLIIVVISLDRYYTIRRPLRQRDARIRARRMLVAAWIGATASALFQMLVYQVLTHPMFPEWRQCVTFGTLRTDAHRIAYNLFCAAVMFFFPLAVILYCYGTIFSAVSATATARNSHGTRESWPNGSAPRVLDQQESSNTALTTTAGMRRLAVFRLFFRITEDMTEIERARVRAMKISLVIVLAFLLCWSPYQLIHFWYIVHPTSAENIPFWIQDALCFFAVSNSLVNPIVYGFFARKKTSNHVDEMVLPVVRPQKLEWRRPIRHQAPPLRGLKPLGVPYHEGIHFHLQERPASPLPNVYKRGHFCHHLRDGFEKRNSDGFLGIRPGVPEIGNASSFEERKMELHLKTSNSKRFAEPKKDRGHPAHDVIIVHNVLNTGDLQQIAAVATVGVEDASHHSPILPTAPKG